MTDQELKDIVSAVVAELEKSGVDFDYKADQAKDDDLVFVIRGTAPNYQGVTVTWKGLLDIITAQATQAKTDAETAKNAANTILEQVQSKGTEITNFVATSKAEIETQKNESVNAVKSVYQTDLNELKGDLDELSDVFIFENLFNANYIINGYISSNGIYVENITDHCVIRFIKIDSSKNYSWNQNYIAFATYDENYTFIERITMNTTKTYQFNGDVKYVKVMVFSNNFIDDFMIVEGSVVPSKYIQHQPMILATSVKDLDKYKGVVKNAIAYNVYPEDDPDTTAINLQKCIDGGGTILIDRNGVYNIGRTIKIPSNTTIIFGSKVFIKRATNAEGKKARYLFSNDGAFTKTYNENIAIYNLKIRPDGEWTGPCDVERPYPGMRGLVTFSYIKNLKIDGFELFDLAYNEYALQVCTFENVHIENVHIECNRDGIHLGYGKRFSVKHCELLTNDDGIALNAVDYPSSNIETGWIEDGIIEDVTFFSALYHGSGYGRKRGVLLLSGSWADWESGNQYQIHGDYCLADGNLYQTYGEHGTSLVTSTVKPTHKSGYVTYPDGVTWLHKQSNVDYYDAGVRNIHFKDIYFYRQVADAFMFSNEKSQNIRASYPNTTVCNKNITFENVNLLYPEQVQDRAMTFLTIRTPTDGIFVRGCDISGVSNSCFMFENKSDISLRTNVNMSCVGNYYDFARPFIKNDNMSSEECPIVNISVCGSMVSSDFHLSNADIIPNFRQCDLPK